MVRVEGNTPPLSEVQAIESAPLQGRIALRNHQTLGEHLHPGTLEEKGPFVDGCHRVSVQDRGEGQRPGAGKWEAPAPGVFAGNTKGGAESLPQRRLGMRSTAYPPIPLLQKGKKMAIIGLRCNQDCCAERACHSYRAAGWFRHPAACRNSCFRPHAATNCKCFSRKIPSIHT